MIDRQKVIDQVATEIWERDSSEAAVVAEQIVDLVIIPLMAEHENQNIQLQIASVVDASGAMYQASIKRQRDSIDRLLAERGRLKDVISGLEEAARIANAHKV